MTNILTASNSREVNPILEEYKPHLKSLTEGPFCGELSQGVGEDLWNAIKPKNFHVDAFFDVS